MRETEESFSIPPLARCRSLDIARTRSCNTGWLRLPGMTKRNRSSRRVGSSVLVSVFSCLILPSHWCYLLLVFLVVRMVVLLHRLSFRWFTVFRVGEEELELWPS
jgi:hypothetical protein